MRGEQLVVLFLEPHAVLGQLVSDPELVGIGATEYRYRPIAGGVVEPRWPVASLASIAPNASGRATATRNI